MPPTATPLRLPLALAALLLAPAASAQTTALLEDFEDADVTYTASEGEFSDGDADFFTRTDGSNVAGSYEVSGANGSSFFAAQDVDARGRSARPVAHVQWDRRVRADGPSVLGPLCRG